MVNRDSLKNARITITRPKVDDFEDFELDDLGEGVEEVGASGGTAPALATAPAPATAPSPSQALASPSPAPALATASSPSQALASPSPAPALATASSPSQAPASSPSQAYSIGVVGLKERDKEPSNQGTAESDDIVFSDEDLEYFDVADESFKDRANKAADSILTVLFHEGDEFKTARKHLYTALPPSVFNNEHYMLYRLFYENKDRNFALTPDFIEAYYSHHLGDIENAGRKIDIQAHGKVDDSYAKGYIAGILKKYDELAGLEPSRDEKFHRDVENYRIYRKYQLSEDLLANSYEILESGYRQKGTSKTLAGFEDMSSYLKRELGTISSLFDKDNGTGYISLKDAIFNPPEESKVVKLGDFGDVDELNEALGGLYSGQLVTVAGPSKSGKSKFTARLVYDMVRRGHNVTVWPVEGGIQMFQAQIRAMHFHEYYSEGTDGVTDFNFPVSQEVIYQGTWDSIETDSSISLKELEQVSARDLVDNTTYGTIDLIDMNLTLENFIEVLDGSISSNNSVAFLVDYMQLIDSSDKNLSRQAVLQKAYPKLLTYCKQKNVLGISPAQYTQGAVNEMGKGGVADTRTMIGSSYEIFKTSDLVLAMAGTVEELKDGIITFESIPARLSKPFDRFQIYADLGACQFMSINHEGSQHV